MKRDVRKARGVGSGFGGISSYGGFEVVFEGVEKTVYVIDVRKGDSRWLSLSGCPLTSNSVQTLSLVYAHTAVEKYNIFRHFPPTPYRSYFSSP